MDSTMQEQEQQGEQRRVDLAIWRRLLRYLRPYRRQVAGLAVLAMTTAAVEISFPLLTRRVIDTVAAGEPLALGHYAAAYLGLLTVLALTIRQFIRLGGIIQTHVSHDIREAGFSSLQRQSFAFYDHRPVGWLMARMTADTDHLARMLAWGVLDLFWGVTLMVGISITLVVLAPGLGLLVLCVVPVLLWVSGRFQRHMLGSARATRAANSRITASVNEAIGGVRTTKLFRREAANLQDFRALTGESYTAALRYGLQSALFLPVVVTLGSLATGLALAVGGGQVLAGGLSIGTLVAFMSYVRHFFDPTEELARWFAQLQSAQAAAERILGLINAEPAIQDSPAVRARLAAAPHGAGLATDGFANGVQEVMFRGVGFDYGNGVTVLRDIDFRVRRGETLALVGATGSGKSTLVSLLCRFYEPTRGEILIDGVEYRERSLHWLQSQLSAVLQTPHIFSGTVAENIRYARPGASLAEVEHAARLAGAHEFIVGLPGGYDAPVGEGGGRLSAGQQQLLAIARALLADRPLLILDEATASVDTDTERRLQAGLRTVLAGRIGIVIAHRLATVRDATKILVLERGRIVEQGSHRELLARRGRYHGLYTGQLQGEEGEAWAALEKRPSPAPVPVTGEGR